MMGHTTHVLVVIKRDVATVRYPSNTNNDDDPIEELTLFTFQEAQILKIGSDAREDIYLFNSLGCLWIRKTISHWGCWRHFQLTKCMICWQMFTK
jgi:hypothetical protein